MASNLIGLFPLLVVICMYPGFAGVVSKALENRLIEAEDGGLVGNGFCRGVSSRTRENWV